MPRPHFRHLAFVLCMAAACGLGSACTGNTGSGCVTSQDCASGEACVAGACQAGLSVECTTNDECLAGEFCDPLTQTCQTVQPAFCTEDANCPPQQRCNTTTQICVDGVRPCQDNAQCTGGLTCDTASGRCVECIDSSTCGGRMCIDGFCQDNNTGPAPDAGTPNTGMDAGGNPGCGDDSQCLPPQTICEGGMCTLGCGQPGGQVCNANEVCDTMTGRCVRVAGPCQMDSECGPPAMVCEGGQCVGGCGERGGIQCSGGTVCDITSGRCVAGGPVCLADTDCNPPSTICNLNSGQCDPGCVTTGCTAPATCNMNTGHCVGLSMCQMDGFEPNNSASQASSIGPGSQPTLGACPNDDDFYSITLNAGATLDVNLTFQHGEGNIDLELLDPNGAVVAQSRTTNDNESLSYAVAGPGDYIIRVTLAQDLGANAGNTYGMTTSLNGGSTCAADMLEPNNDRTTATPIMPGTGLGLNVCPNDDDFYAIQAQAGQEIAVSAVFRSLEGDIDLELLDDTGRVLETSMGIIGPETMTHIVAATGTYYIRVHLVFDLGTMDGNNYAFSVSVDTPPPMAMCMADALEENDSAAAAQPIPPGTQGNLTSCDGDEDFYAITAGVGDSISVNLNFSHAEGDIDAQLRTPAGNLVGSGLSSTDNEAFNYTVTDAGAHVLRVYLVRDQGMTPGNPYSMNIGVQGPAMCVNDMFEDNDGQSAATSINPATYSGLGICDQDDDYYNVSVSQGQTLTVNLQFTDAEGDVDVAILDANGTVLDSGTSASDNETTSYTATANGTLTVRVYLYRDDGNSPGNTYDMTITR